MWVCVQLYRIELERDQLHHASESMAARHKEELEAIQKSHEYVSYTILFIVYLLIVPDLLQV